MHMTALQLGAAAILAAVTAWLLLVAIWMFTGWSPGRLPPPARPQRIADVLARALHEDYLAVVAEHGTHPPASCPVGGCYLCEGAVPTWESYPARSRLGNRNIMAMELRQKHFDPEYPAARDSVLTRAAVHACFRLATDAEIASWIEPVTP
jgi:hypothetical protein